MTGYATPGVVRFKLNLETVSLAALRVEPLGTLYGSFRGHMDFVVLILGIESIENLRSARGKPLYIYAIYTNIESKHLYNPHDIHQYLSIIDRESMRLWPANTSPLSSRTFYSFSFPRRLISSLLSVQRCIHSDGAGIQTLWCSAVAYIVLPSTDSTAPRRRAMVFP